MAVKHRHQAKVDMDGNLVIPVEVARKFGLKPGAEFYLEEKENSISIPQPVTQLSKLYIEPTSLCNLACRTCMRNIWDEPMGRMSEAVFGRIVDDLPKCDPHPAVFFGGFGEPLFHPGIVDMVAQVKRVGSTAALITNGILLDKQCASQLIKAGLSRLWVSVDGATPEHYADIRLGAALPQIFENIVRYRDLYREMVGGDPDIGLVFVAMKRNISDLPDLLRMSIKLGVSRYLVTNVLPYTQEMCEERLYTRSVDTLASAPSPWFPALQFPQMDVSPSTREPLMRTIGLHPHNFLTGGTLGEQQNACPFIRQGSAAVAWDGSLSPCLPLMHAHESFLINLHRSVQRYTLGNLLQQDLATIWTAPEYVDFRKRVDEFDFSPCTSCASCELAEANREDCFGSTFPTCGGCLWAQGFIRCP